VRTPSVLHLDIDAFFAAVEEALEPALRGKPLIVGGLAHERGVVCTASYAARRYGVHSGMALRTAAKKCPQAVFRRGRYHLYSRISEQFFACLRRFSPRIEEVSVDEAYVDVGGSRDF
jgi:DNA polymerase-4